jgi:hypothetical protein
MASSEDSDSESLWGIPEPEESTVLLKIGERCSAKLTVASAGGKLVLKNTTLELFGASVIHHGEPPCIPWFEACDFDYHSRHGRYGKHRKAWPKALDGCVGRCRVKLDGWTFLWNMAVSKSSQGWRILCTAAVECKPPQVQVIATFATAADEV